MSDLSYHNKFLNCVEGALGLELNIYELLEAKHKDRRLLEIYFLRH